MKKMRLLLLILVILLGIVQFSPLRYSKEASDRFTGGLMEEYSALAELLTRDCELVSDGDERICYGVFYSGIDYDVGAGNHDAKVKRYSVQEDVPVFELESVKQHLLAVLDAPVGFNEPFRIQAIYVEPKGRVTFCSGEGSQVIIYNKGLLWPQYYINSDRTRDAQCYYMFFLVPHWYYGWVPR